MTTPIRCPARLLIAGVCCALACSGSSDSPIVTPPNTTVAVITLTAPATTLPVGQTMVVTAQARNAAGQPVSTTFTWQSVNTAVASVSASGTVTAIAQGVTVITASSGTVQSGPVVLTVTSTVSGDVATVTVSPSSVVVAVGETRTLNGVARDTSGQPVTATLVWRTSTASVATVDATGKLTALAVGTTNITASSGAIQSVPVVVTVGSNAPWPTIGASSEQMINDALKQGTLTDEQALVYNVFAMFADPRLPAAYRGVGDSNVDNPALTAAARRMSTLSAGAQAQLAPFFVPPGYAGSWFAARAQSFAGAASGAVHGASGAQTCDEIDAIWTKRTTAHFDIHYISSDVAGAAIAGVVVAAAENVWNVETATFDRFPPSDANAGRRNGCDGALDVWIVPFGGSALLDAKGWTSQYDPTICTGAPSNINIWDTHSPDATKIRGTLAHEFFHVLEVGSYSRNLSCSADDSWLGEATADWAMDLVYPDEQAEQSYAQGYVRYERLAPLDQAFEGDRVGTNGYSDYVFLFYLARKYKNSMIKAIWDAAEHSNSLDAIAAALASNGGLKEVWPAFALDLWNDFQVHTQDDFHVWDKLEWGLKKMFDEGDAGTFGLPSTKVELQGGQRKTFLMGESETFFDGNQLQRLTVVADYFKFTDASVSSVLFINPMVFANFPTLKIQALIKQGGVWQDAEDWTRVPYQSFCRDRKDERIEELALIYSNSDGARPSPPISFSVVPRLSVSNVGCDRWDGTAQITTVESGETNDATATVRFRRVARDPLLPIGPAGFETFAPDSGNVVGSQTGGCITRNAQGPILPTDATLVINLDNLDLGVGAAPDRLIQSGMGSSTLRTRSDHCVGLTVFNDAVWSWLEIPEMLYSVSPDGRTITATTTLTLPVFTTTKRWTLRAVREP